MGSGHCIFNECECPFDGSITCLRDSAAAQGRSVDAIILSERPIDVLR